MQHFKMDLGQYLKIKNLLKRVMVPRNFSIVAIKNRTNAYLGFNFFGEVSMKTFDIIKAEIYITMTSWSQVHFLKNISNRKWSQWTKINQIHSHKGSSIRCIREHYISSNKFSSSNNPYIITQMGLISLWENHNKISHFIKVYNNTLIL